MCVASRHDSILEHKLLFHLFTTSNSSQNMGVIRRYIFSCGAELNIYAKEKLGLLQVDAEGGGRWKESKDCLYVGRRENKTKKD